MHETWSNVVKSCRTSFRSAACCCSESTVAPTSTACSSCSLRACCRIPRWCSATASCDRAFCSRTDAAAPCFSRTRCFCRASALRPAVALSSGFRNRHGAIAILLLFDVTATSTVSVTRLGVGLGSGRVLAAATVSAVPPRAPSPGPARAFGGELATVYSAAARAVASDTAAAIADTAPASTTTRFSSGSGSR